MLPFLVPLLSWSRLSDVSSTKFVGYWPVFPLQHPSAHPLSSVSFIKMMKVRQIINKSTINVHITMLKQRMEIGNVSKSSTAIFWLNSELTLWFFYRGPNVDIELISMIILLWHTLCNNVDFDVDIVNINNDVSISTRWLEKNIVKKRHF